MKFDGVENSLLKIRSESGKLCFFGCRFPTQIEKFWDTVHTTSDVFEYLLVASDPVLSSLGLQERRHMYARRQGKLLPQTLALLAEPQLPAADEDSDNSNDGSDSGGSSNSAGSSDSAGSSCSDDE